ncbi:MAG: DUF4214 domain-containing protein [Clostridia bacterium]|nr:DUF4214 domain-containing protein [Clostridia bacterium]
MKLKLTTKKVLATVVASVMTVGLFSGLLGKDLIRADVSKNQNNTCLGTSKIAAPAKPEDCNSAWSGSYVYYGMYKDNPIKFRVLAPSTTAYGGSTLFLDSDKALFSDCFDYTSPYSNAWDGSYIQGVLNGSFLNGFTRLERGAIATSQGNGGLTYDSYLTYFYGAPVSINDKVFLLDASEVMNSAYGYSSDCGWVDTDGDGDWSTGSWGWHEVANRVKVGSSAFWWLRSAGTRNSSYASKVFSDGFLDISNVSNTFDVAPALNIDLSSVIFSTAIDGDLGALGSSYKLTVLNDGLSVNTDSVSFNGTKISGTATGNADQVSVLITDGEWNAKDSTIKYYGVYSGSFDYASYVSSNMHLYLISEDINSAKETDYASAPVEIINMCTVTFDSNGGSGSMPNMMVSENSKITLPECSFNPPSSDKAFKYWKVSSIAGYSVPGDEVTIMYDTQVKAIWSTAYSVTFNMNGHGTAPASQKVASGNKAVMPSDPSASGYTFGGWYRDSACTEAYDLNTKVTTDITLYAKWTAVSTPDPVKPDPTTTPEPAKGGGFEDFVERLYTVALNRASEPEGKAFWCEHVGNGDLNGAQCANEFLLSKEFNDRKLTDEQFLEVLYKTFFDRDAKEDKDGFSFWMNSLKTQGRDSVVDCFINSEEWCNVCASYGVKSGATRAKATIASANATAFATRLYTECLGRDPEEGGLKFWALGLTNLELTGKQAAYEFFFSKEFNDHNYDNEGLITRMYTTFMGREPDEGGMNFWLDSMKNGMDKEQVFNEFVKSAEFTGICQDYAIDRG